MEIAHASNVHAPTRVNPDCNTLKLHRLRSAGISRNLQTSCAPIAVQLLANLLRPHQPRSSSSFPRPRRSDRPMQFAALARCPRSETPTRSASLRKFLLRDRLYSIVPRDEGACFRRSHSSGSTEHPRQLRQRNACARRAQRPLAFVGNSEEFFTSSNSFCRRVLC